MTRKNSEHKHSMPLLIEKLLGNQVNQFEPLISLIFTDYYDCKNQRNQINQHNQRFKFKGDFP